MGKEPLAWLPVSLEPFLLYAARGSTACPGPVPCSPPGTVCPELGDRRQVAGPGGHKPGGTGGGQWSLLEEEVHLVIDHLALRVQALEDLG